jgi:lipopolysaccharide assembly protein A
VGFVRLLTSAAWIAVFAVALLFAIKNAEPVAVHFYFDRSWQAPLVFVVLASFAAGAVCGVIACLPPLVRSRRSLAGLQKELGLRAAEAAPREPARTLAPDVPSQP